MVILAAGLGTRMRPVSGYRPKTLLDVGGLSIFDRLLDLGGFLGLEPVVVTRPENAPDFRGHRVQVLTVESSPHILSTLAAACRALPPGPFCWVGADMVYADHAPFQGLLAAHRELGSVSSFFYCRGDRFKAKLELAPEPAVTVSRAGAFERSIPNFLIHAADVAPWLPGDLVDPRGNYVQRSIERGERIHFREYTAPVFEIDTPADLDAARRYFARCA
jgi:GTP:adenosylcobinamide-phosphate guanylyltransferase